MSKIVESIGDFVFGGVGCRSELGCIPKGSEGMAQFMFDEATPTERTIEVRGFGRLGSAGESFGNSDQFGEHGSAARFCGVSCDGGADLDAHESGLDFFGAAAFCVKARNGIAERLGTRDRVTHNLALHVDADDLFLLDSINELEEHGDGSDDVHKSMRIPQLGMSSKRVLHQHRGFFAEARARAITCFLCFKVRSSPKS